MRIITDQRWLKFGRIMERFSTGYALFILGLMAGYGWAYWHFQVLNNVAG